MKNNRKNKIVLILEDDPDAGMLVSRIMKSLGFISKVVTSIGEAKSTIRMHKDFDLFFFDYNLPDGKSLQMLKDIHITDSPTIIYSAYLNDTALEEAKKLGVLECLHKPIDFNIVYSTLAKYQLI